MSPFHGYHHKFHCSPLILGCFGRLQWRGFSFLDFADDRCWVGGLGDGAIGSALFSVSGVRSRKRVFASAADATGELVMAKRQMRGAEQVFSLDGLLDAYLFEVLRRMQGSTRGARPPAFLAGDSRSSPTSAPPSPCWSPLCRTRWCLTSPSADRTGSSKLFHKIQQSYNAVN
jgi:hypothetical protein